ncbi:hypothetical protein B9Z65_5350 [Elsinoe australis]|uniref:Yippee domain-containing protein n=1 Tax=Elsinoe australis TaxID=40998 RepID=A0A2P7ZDU8_9PEZI|nr:hypothetical protein B9Z65_5350 [Elsinoe australis]
MPFPHIPSPPALFPTYLTSPLSFRRKSSTDSTTSTASTTSSAGAPSLFPTMPSPGHEGTTARPTPTYLSGSTSRLRCARCLSDLALSSQIISKGFTGRHGRAYLVAPPSSLTSPMPFVPAATASLWGASSPFASSSQSTKARKGDLPNTYTHRAVPRQLVTGQHTVGDISCAQCGSVLGWKYVAAEEEAQRYKVGKFILEGKRVVSWGGWEGEDDETGRWEDGSAGEGSRTGGDDGADEEIEFDSQDEDECEDLFLGVWTPQLAARRRRAKRFGGD